MIKSYSLSQNTFFLLISYIIEKLLVFFYFIFLARYLGPEKFGIYSFAVSFVAIFSIFLDLGFSTVLVREIAKTREKTEEYFRNALTFKFVTSFFTTLFIILTINLLGYPPLTRYLIYLMIPWIIFESFGSTFYAFLRGWQNLLYEATGLILNKATYIFVGLIFILLKLPLITFAIPLIIGGFFYFIYPFFSTRKIFVFKPILKKKIISFFLKTSIPLFLGIVFYILFSYINTILVSRLASDYAAGLFSASLRIPMALLFLPGAFGAAIFPVFSSLVKEGSKEKISFIFEKVFFYLIIFSLPLTLGGIILGEDLIYFLYGSKFIGAETSFRILIGILVFTFLDFLFSSLFTAFNKQTKNTIARGIGLGTNIILCFFLIPRLAHVGGAIAFVTGWSIFFLIQFILLLKLVNLKFLRLVKKLSSVIFSSLLMSFLLLIFKEQIHFIFSLFLGAISYFITLYLIGGLKKEDLKEIKSLIKSSFKIKTEGVIEERMDD